VDDTARFILLYLVYPLWVAAGFIDWLCHRATGIARTSGLPENLLHLLMFGEIGVGMLAVALLEVNAAVLAIVAVVFVVHELTVYVDLRYTVAKRHVGPFEQMVHSFMEILPLLSLALLAVQADLHDWSLGWKRDPLPAGYLATAAAAAFFLNALPLLQETWSCLRARTPARPAPR
jgi:hypothetical protein